MEQWTPATAAAMELSLALDDLTRAQRRADDAVERVVRATSTLLLTRGPRSADAKKLLLELHASAKTARSEAAHGTGGTSAVLLLGSQFHSRRRRGATDRTAWSGDRSVSATSFSNRRSTGNSNTIRNADRVRDAWHGHNGRYVHAREPRPKLQVMAGGYNRGSRGSQDHLRSWLQVISRERVGQPSLEQSSDMKKPTEATVVESAAVEAATAAATALAVVSDTGSPPLSLAVMALPELQQLLPGRLGLDTFTICRGLAPGHLQFLSHTLPLLPSAAAAVAARVGRNAAGMPVTSLAFGSFAGGLSENRELGQCCCAGVRLDGDSDDDDANEGESEGSEVAVVLGVGEAEEIMNQVTLRLPSRDSTDERHWVTPPPFATPRSHFGVCTTNDGRIIVAGGVSESGQVLASVEMYDPATREWCELPPMLRVRACCTALPLSAGLPTTPSSEAAALPARGLAIIGGLTAADVGEDFDSASSTAEQEEGSESSAADDLFAEMYDFNTQQWLALPALPGLVAAPHAHGPFSVPEQQPTPAAPTRRSLYGVGAATVGGAIVVGGGILLERSFPSTAAEEEAIVSRTHWRGAAILSMVDLDGDCRMEASLQEGNWIHRAGQAHPPFPTTPMPKSWMEPLATHFLSSKRQ